MHSCETTRQAKLTSSHSWTATCAIILLFIPTAIAAPAQTFTTLADFPFHIDGGGVGLIQGTDGDFYGITTDGGATNSECTPFGSCGTIFKVTPTGTLTILHAFCSTTPCTGGWFPNWLIRGGDGNFYGTTAFGGANHPNTCSSGCGTMFKITPTGTFTTLYNFCALAGCADGGAPGSFVQAFAGGVFGDVYGSTLNGGAFGHGTIFSITPKGQLTVLHNSCAQANCSDGFGSGPLTQDVGGNFYGVAPTGSGEKSCNNGWCDLIFRMTPAGTVTVLHSFPGPILLNADLVKGTDGLFYGTTQVSGKRVANLCFAQGCGTIFKVSAGGEYSTIYDFCSQASCADGSLPEVGLIQATDGNFYGSTGSGGGPNYGTLFMITSSGVFTSLHSFCQTDCADGSSPQQRLVQGTDGRFYGITQGGGINLHGTIFSLDMGLAPFVTFLISTGPVGTKVGILGQGFTGTTAVSFNGTPATFTTKSDTYVTAVVPAGATTGSVTVTTPSGTLTSNVAYRVTQ